ncbi:MAG: NAD-dependent epimerase/dehydratase family protein [Candidatus Latescibacteria bacterium]|jgi:2'-hydroxyisoflavone reductase|nr:NAD-dependent epimerase/dehydratase family protein [Candidatus Latescibacterota bacterium]
MNLLVLGGTVFLGRYVVLAAESAGHNVTMFNRGQTAPDLFPHIERLHGDRDGDLDALLGRSWDAVIDTSSYLPRVVRQSAEVLRDVVGHYTFISSISTYASFTGSGINEEEPVGSLEDDTVEEISGDTYGPLKALCESTLRSVFPDRLLVIRPGLIVGPHDPTDRFAYWPHRIDRGGQVIVPGRSDAPLQFIDVRDVAEWIVAMVAQDVKGVYNATGPQNPLQMGEFIETCRAACSNDAELIWMDDDYLAAHEVAPFVELPLWLPTSADHRGFFDIDCSLAIRDGLTFRPLLDTVEATLEWDRERPHHTTFKSTLSTTKEKALVDAWKG